MHRGGPGRQQADKGEGGRCSVSLPPEGPLFVCNACQPTFCLPPPAKTQHQATFAALAPAELPQERLDEIFMIPMPAAAQHRQQQQQSQQRQAQREGQVAAAPAVAGQRQPRQLSLQGEAGSSGAATRPWPRRRESADGAGPSAAAQGTASPPAAPAAPAEDARVAKRARRAQERAYNEAVIGGADPDAALARQLQDSETHAGAGGRHANDDAQRGRGAPPGQRGAAPRRMTVQARLAAKLLRGRALAAAVADETRTESEVRRDKFGNRW